MQAFFIVRAGLPGERRYGARALVIGQLHGQPSQPAISAGVVPVFAVPGWLARSFTCSAIM